MGRSSISFLCGIRAAFSAELGEPKKKMPKKKIDGKTKF
jgi:hypothetical protein